MPIYTASTDPDSLTGAIFAIEGIFDAAVVLNGPTGCKFYHSAISDSQLPRHADYDPLQFAERCFFGQPRVPATYLDGDDYVFGSSAKLTEVFAVVAAKGFALVAVVNSPGAALIGDDLNRLMANQLADVPHLAIESTGFSGQYGEGFATAVNRLIDTLDLPPVATDPLAVNLLGLSLSQKYFEHNYATLRELLALCGVRVVTAFGATDSLATVRQARQATLNVVVCPENGLATALKLERDWGMPYLTLEHGQPVGFAATSAFIADVCAALTAVGGGSASVGSAGGSASAFAGSAVGSASADAVLTSAGASTSAAAATPDPWPAEQAVQKARARAYLYLSRYASLLGEPKGALYSIRAEASLAYPLAAWLSGYLGMVPAAIEVVGGPDAKTLARLQGYLESINCFSTLGRPVAETPTELILADGDTISASRLAGQRAACIEIGYPALTYLDVTRKQLYGPEGALFLLEQIMNGLRFV